jgi:hypothetical protein
MADKIEYKVEMINEDSPKATRTYKQTIINFGSLGRQLRIGSKSHVTINKPGYKQEFFVESVSLLIGIGKDHSADIIMSKEAWEAFKAGEKLDVTTLKEFKERFL